MRNLKQGETIRFVLNGGASNSSTTAVQLFDANNGVRPLKPYERLVVDSVYLDIIGSATFLYLVSVPGDTNNVSLRDVNAHVFGSTIIAGGDFSEFGTGTPPSPAWVTFDGEGVSCPVGVTPSVYNEGADGATTLVYGTGRIVEGKTQGIRPSWRESMVRGD